MISEERRLKEIKYQKMYHDNLEIYHFEKLINGAMFVMARTSPYLENIAVYINEKQKMK